MHFITCNGVKRARSNMHVSKQLIDYISWPRIYTISALFSRLKIIATENFRFDDRFLYNCYKISDSNNCEEKLSYL